MFDAVLLISFGGPQGVADIRPFLANVLRGRRVSPDRVAEVARHYELFGGVSPLTALTLAQADGLRRRLEAAGQPLPVYVGMRNWHPYLADTFEQMHDAGVRRAVGFITSAFHSYSSCQQYRENVAAARAELRARRPGRDIDVTYVASWFDHRRFIEALAARVRDALDELPGGLSTRARIVFTAHSIPTSMADKSRYREQLLHASELVAGRLARDWALTFQSRSGRPDDPWLEPDVRDYLRSERARGLEAAVICPIGFVCDHVEVLYDLDHQAAQLCREIGLPMVRAAALNDHPVYLDMMSEVVRATIQRYSGRPLPLAPSNSPVALGQPVTGESRR